MSKYDAAALLIIIFCHESAAAGGVHRSRDDGLGVLSFFLEGKYGFEKPFLNPNEWCSPVDQCLRLHILCPPSPLSIPTTAWLLTNTPHFS